MPKHMEKHMNNDMKTDLFLSSSGITLLPSDLHLGPGSSGGFETAASWLVPQIPNLYPKSKALSGIGTSCSGLVWDRSILDLSESFRGRFRV